MWKMCEKVKKSLSTLATSGTRILFINPASHNIEFVRRSKYDEQFINKSLSHEGETKTTKIPSEMFWRRNQKEKQKNSA